MVKEDAKVKSELVIVPDELSNLINEALDAAFKEQPEAATDREELFSYLLGFFDAFGYIPDFRLEKR